LPRGQRNRRGGVVAGGHELNRPRGDEEQDWRRLGKHLERRNLSWIEYLAHEVDIAVAPGRCERFADEEHFIVSGGRDLAGIHQVNAEKRNRLAAGGAFAIARSCRKKNGLAWSKPSPGVGVEVIDDQSATFRQQESGVVRCLVTGTRPGGAGDPPSELPIRQRGNPVRDNRGAAFRRRQRFPDLAQDRTCNQQGAG
jgi:hypothetical protein